MQWIFLSPHLDDAALSCGGLIWRLTRRGDPVEIWTIFAGDPPPGAQLSTLASALHKRWSAGNNPVPARRQEDLCACRRLGAQPRHFNLPDCIYRSHPLDGGPRITSDEDLFGGNPLLERRLLADLRAMLAAELPVGARVVCPVTIGGHIDHRLTRLAAEGLGMHLWYYPDYPYAAMPRTQGLPWHEAGWQPYYLSASKESLAAWGDAVACYTSQISSFWKDAADMRTALADYRRSGGGRLWR
ncbi:MAG: PIG-L family deacetylase [Anaerolineae bacterium]|nr:PIG-L family deacetylase [Anaerolineae bacterium]